MITKRKSSRLSDPAYEIIHLLRSRGYKANLLPPDDPQDDSKVEEILEKILSGSTVRKSPK